MNCNIALTYFTGVMTAIIALGIAVTSAVGPEKRGSHFESAVIGQSADVYEAERKESDIEKADEAIHHEKK